MEDHTVVAHGCRKTEKLICGMEDHLVVAHGCRKTEKLICRMEGKNGVAYGHGCLPSPAHGEGGGRVLQDRGFSFNFLYINMSDHNS